MSSDSSFREHMGSFFHDLLRAAGITMIPGNANERLRSIGERMASAIERAAERQAIEVIKRLQSAVSEAFRALEKELEDQKALIQAHHTLIENLLDEQKRLRLQLEDLRAQRTTPPSVGSDNWNTED